MNNKFIKFLCLLLIVCMIVPFTACDDSEGGDETTKKEDTTTSQSTIYDPGLPNKKFNGEELVFLSSGGDTNPRWAVQDIYPESGRETQKPVMGQGYGVINDAVFLRNQSLEAKYDVKIVEEPQLSRNDQFEPTFRKNAKEASYHAAVLPLTYACTSSKKGYFYDLNSEYIQYINLEQSWWDQRMTENMSIYDRIDYATGDLLTSDNDATFIIMFNKTLHKNLKLDNIYELVQDKKWTIDKMTAMATTAKVDEKGDGKFDYFVDTIGFATTSNVPHCLMYGCGFVSAAKENGVLKYAVDLERFERMVNPIIELTYSAKNPFLTQNMEYGGTENVETNGISTFGGNKALFYGECLQSVTRLRGEKVEFGVVPYPKLNEEQLGYHSNMVGAVGCVVVIPKSTKGSALEMTDFMLEAMAAASKRQLTPAYYQRSIKGEIQDEESVPMLDIILETRVYDLGYYYEWGGLVTQASTDLKNGVTSASNNIKSRKSKFEKTMALDVEKYQPKN